MGVFEQCTKILAYLEEERRKNEKKTVSGFWTGIFLTWESGDGML